MNPETCVVTDATYRLPLSKNVTVGMQKQAAEKLKYAAVREQELLNSAGVVDVVFICVGKIKDILAKTVSGKTR